MSDKQTKYAEHHRSDQDGQSQSNGKCGAWNMVCTFISAGAAVVAIAQAELASQYWHDLSQKELQAFVTVGNARLISQTEALITFKNTGATPAPTVVFSEPTVWTDIQPMGDQFVGAVHVEPGAPVPLAAGQEIDLPVDVKVDPALGRLHISGRIDYEDAFGNPRWTTYHLVHGDDTTDATKPNLFTHRCSSAGGALGRVEGAEGPLSPGGR